MESRTADVDDLLFRWEEEGEGTPAVFIHGLPTGPRLWRHVVPRLSDCRALAWEMVGYATSIEQGEGRDISVARQAEYLVRWMDAIGLRQAVLVGHDLGGGVAQIAAVRHPDRVQGLIFTNAICYDSWPIPSVKLLGALGPLLARGPDALVYLIMATLFFRGHELRQDDARRQPDGASRLRAIRPGLWRDRLEVWGYGRVGVCVFFSPTRSYPDWPIHVVND